MIIILLTVSNITLLSQFSGGSGTASNPYEIANGTDIAALADSVNRGNNWSNNKYFKLMNNITTPVTTIIGSSANGKYFLGNFNGNNYTITLNIRGSNEVGLFGFTRNATITNLNVAGSVIGNYYVGGIAGKADYSEFTNCNNNASIQSDAAYGGGIAGRTSSSKFTNCNNYASIIGKETVGGIAGFVYFYDSNSGCEFTNCSNYASIRTTISAGSMGAQAGGIAGCAEYNSKFTNCNNNASVVARVAVGGIAGEGSTSNFTNCMNNGKIGNDNSIAAGGITGIGSKCNITTCINIGSIEGKEDVGGICGYSMGNVLIFGELSNCINSGFIKGNTQIGGIIGYLRNANVESCINVGVITGETCGAIVGLNYYNSGTVTNCFYDKQMCIYEGIQNGDITGQAEGKLSKEMIGNQLRTKLGTVDWTYTDNIYPMLTILASKEASKVAASVIYFCNDADRHNDLQYNFKISTVNNVVWNKRNNRINIINDNCNLTSLGSDTLTAEIGIYKKEIVIIITAIRSCIYHSYFDLLLNTNPPTGAGTVKGGGTNIQGGIKVTIEAVPDACYNFKGWTNDKDDFISPNNPLNITLISDSALTAVFELKRFDLILSKEPIIGGIVSGDGSYDCGASVTIDAIADNGYEFLKWTDSKGNLFSLNPSVKITMNAEQHYIAHFNEIEIITDRHTLNLNSNPIGANLAGAGVYNDSASVTVYANFTNSCYTFKNWTDKYGVIISPYNPFNFTIKSDTLLTANFDVKVFDLSMNATVGGSVIPSGIIKTHCNDTVIFTAFPDNSYKFKNWSNSDTVNPLSVTIMGDTNLVANFIKEDVVLYKVQASIKPENAGTVTGSSNYELNETATLTAIANACYEFKYWSNDNGDSISNENQLIINVTKDTNITANFELLQYDLNVSSSGNGSVTPNGISKVNCNSSQTLNATAAAGYKFSKWTDKNYAFISSSNPLEITVIYDTILIANFIDENSEELFTVKLISNPTTAGVLIGGGDYKLKEIVNISAEANTDYKFLNWRNQNNTIVSLNPNFVIEVAKDTILTANFEKINTITESIKSETIKISPNPTNKDFTISFDIIKPNNIKIILMDLLGREMINIYDNFAEIGHFNKVVNVANLNKGTYYLEISINNNSKVEKIIVE